MTSARIDAQAAELERYREALVPTGSLWRNLFSGEVWQVLERDGSVVLLHMPGTRRHKSGPLAGLLRRYTQMPRIVRHGLYLSRHGREVGIVGPAGMPHSSRWAWLTTRGYYVTADGRAAIVGQSSDDLVKDITPSDDQIAGMDSTLLG